MRIRTLSAAALSLTAALAIGGCARGGGARADTSYVARDVGTLYSAAKTRLDRGQYKEAAALFDEVERQHPYSIWARRAQLMGAFSYYGARDYTQAIQGAQRFLSVHPGNRDAPYAYYLIAMSYYEQVGDVTRDQKITQQAMDALGELGRRYPNTRYAADARLKIDLVRDHLAGKEMEIGRFYGRRGQWLAASMRFRHVVDDYQMTTHTPEALMRLTETYLALGLRDEAKKSAAVLGANYPGTDWYSRAFQLAEANPEVAAPAKPIESTATPPPQAGTAEAAAAGDDPVPADGSARAGQTPTATTEPSAPGSGTPAVTPGIAPPSAGGTTVPR